MRASPLYYFVLFSIFHFILFSSLLRQFHHLNDFQALQWIWSRAGKYKIENKKFTPNAFCFNDHCYSFGKKFFSSPFLSSLSLPQHVQMGVCPCVHMYDRVYSLQFSTTVFTNDISCTWLFFRSNKKVCVCVVCSHVCVHATVCLLPAGARRGLRSPKL